MSSLAWGRNKLCTFKYHCLKFFCRVLLMDLTVVTQKLLSLIFHLQHRMWIMMFSRISIALESIEVITWHQCTITRGLINSIFDTQLIILIWIKLSGCCYLLTSRTPNTHDLSLERRQHSILMVFFICNSAKVLMVSDLIRGINERERIREEVLK